MLLKLKLLHRALFYKALIVVPPVPLVNDLLEYCEELEDSQDDDSAAGEDENMDED